MAASPLPRPNQPGRFIRVCDQANTHGIARRSARSMAAAGPPPEAAPAAAPPEAAVAAPPPEAAVAAPPPEAALAAGLAGEARPRLAGREPIRRPPISPSGPIRAYQSAN